MRGVGRATTCIITRPLPSLVHLCPSPPPPLPLLLQTYENVTIFNKRGTPTAFITLCGPPSAVINGKRVENTLPYLMLVRNSEYIRLAGFKVRNGFLGE
jgi:hypothetical protein